MPGLFSWASKGVGRGLEEGWKRAGRGREEDRTSVEKGLNVRLSSGLLIGGGVLALLVVISLLGGSAIWWIIGTPDALRIEGRAQPVAALHDVPTELGVGWSAYGGDGGGHRYSRSRQITRVNVSELDIAWIHRTGSLTAHSDVAHQTSFQTTPILLDDSLVFCSPFNEVIALHPGTGAQRWRFDAKVPTDGDPANQFSCRGVSAWRDSRACATALCRTRVFMGTVDARLIALDALTGQPCREFGDNGEVLIEPSLALRWPGEFQITSAPAIIDDLVITGTSIGDNLRTDAPLGVVHAFNAKTGELAWRFNPIPRGPIPRDQKDWQADQAEHVGHANVWSTIAVDAKRGLVFLPTSTASPDFYGGDRVGDNRHANSVVALDAGTGEVHWSYQIVHHDVWDYDLPAQPGLFQVRRDGVVHDVVVQVTKTGHVFVLDRDTGKPFLPVTERAVPQDGAPGEVLSATQPIPDQPPALVPSRVNANEAFGITLWDKWACESAIGGLRADGLYTPPSIEGTLNYPFSGGGANWGSGAFDPTRNLFVINMNNAAHKLQLHRRPEAQDDANRRDQTNDAAEFAPMEGAPYSMTRELLLSPLGLPCTPPPWGVIAGIDLATGRIVWRHPLGTTEDLAPGGLSLNLGTPSFGGPIVTAGGLIFIAATMDDYLRALDVETGAELWRGRLPAGGQATPMTYEWQGRQFVVIAAGGHAKSATRMGDYLLAFALPSND